MRKRKRKKINFLEKDWSREAKDIQSLIEIAQGTSSVSDKAEARDALAFMFIHRVNEMENADPLFMYIADLLQGIYNGRPIHNFFDIDELEADRAKSRAYRSAIEVVRYIVNNQKSLTEAIEEVSSRFNMSNSTVKKHYYRYREELEKVFGINLNLSRGRPRS